MSKILTSLLTALTQGSLKKFKRQTQNIEITHREFLQKLIATHKNTELGQKLNLEAIKTVEEFRSQIPIHSYGDYQAYIQRMVEGEENLLTPEVPIYFNFTSGTTGKQKIIPVTKTSRKNKEINKIIGFGFLLEAAKARNLTINPSKSLLTSSLQVFGHTQQGIPYGPVSTGDLLYSNFWQKRIFVHPFDALRIKDVVARNYVCLLFALRNSDLSLIGANYPVIALTMAKYLEEYASELIADLQTGKIAPWLNIEPQLRQKLTKKLPANPEIAGKLAVIYQTHGYLTPELVWPNLACIATARGVPSNFYLDKFPSYFGKTPVFGGIYAAAEAVFSIYPDFDQDGSILAINTNFFEFIPSDEWHKENPQTLLPQEVKIGGEYRILVSNYTGLYRYDIGDVIKVVGFYHQTPMITFLHRASGVLTSTTEKTTDAHVIQAVQDLQSKFHVSLENFCLTLSEVDIPPAYVLNIELSGNDNLPQPEEFIQEFDLNLQKLNTCYEIERQSTIPPPHLRILAPGSFAKLAEKLIKQGMPESQLKILNLNQDRQYLSGLEVIQEVKL